MRATYLAAHNCCMRVYARVQALSRLALPVACACYHWAFRSCHEGKCNHSMHSIGR